MSNQATPLHKLNALNFLVDGVGLQLDLVYKTVFTDWSELHKAIFSRSLIHLYLVPEEEEDIHASGW